MSLSMIWLPRVCRRALPVCCTSKMPVRYAVRHMT